MSTDYTAAVSGTGRVFPALLEDALNDSLHPSKTSVRILVASTDARLSEGVMDVLEWGWRNHASVFAYTDGSETSSHAEELLDNADKAIGATDITAKIVEELRDASPFSCLIVLPDESGEMDSDTRELVSLCIEAEIPVYDLTHAMIEIDPFDMEDFAELEKKVEENPVEAMGPPEETFAKGGLKMPEGPGESVTLAAGEWVLDLTNAHHTVGLGEVEVEQLITEAANLITAAQFLHSHLTSLRVPRLRGSAVPGAVPVVAVEPEPEFSVKEHPKEVKYRTLVLDESIGVWRPRGRGRLRNDAKTKREMWSYSLNDWVDVLE